MNAAEHYLASLARREAGRMRHAQYERWEDMRVYTASIMATMLAQLAAIMPPRQWPATDMRYCRR